MQLGDLLAKSGFFADSRGAAQAVVKVLAGREIGFGPIASMTGIHVIQGRVSLSANLMAAAVKRSGRYDYRVLTMSPDKCAIEFRERTPNGWDVIGTSEFTAADAKAAGTQNMAKFARNMLFARAMSNGARWFCPDIFGGPVYTPDELGAQVDGETGEVIDAPAPRIVVEQPASQPAAQTASNGNGAQADPPGFAVWADWRNANDAKAWAMTQGKFNAQKHMENAYERVKTDCKPANAKAMWQCWYEYVMAHEPAKVQPAQEQPDADPDGWQDIDANGVEVPLFQ
jgi:hypothetical protein